MNKHEWKSSVLRCDANEPEDCEICRFHEMLRNGHRFDPVAMAVIEALDAELARKENVIRKLAFTVVEQNSKGDASVNNET